jgi:hypothetical protein
VFWPFNKPSFWAYFKGLRPKYFKKDEKKNILFFGRPMFLNKV